MNSNLQRVSRTFQRPVLGVHNFTYGVVFDVLECIIQRTFGYATLDIRILYETIFELIGSPEVSKVVIIAHSQGSIETGMALDWLYSTLSEDMISKLEVYTFGNAANHWNSPRRQDGEHAIRHVEHYANSVDWVSRFGVLYFRGISEIASEGLISRTDRNISVMKSILAGKRGWKTFTNQFVGRLFVRKASGHQFNQHYLDNMFAMDKLERTVLDGNQFMNCVLDDHNFVDSSAGSDTRGVNGVNCGDDAEPAKLIKDVSRLWCYRNGGLPSKAA